MWHPWPFFSPQIKTRVRFLHFLSRCLLVGTDCPHAHLPRAKWGQLLAGFWGHQSQENSCSSEAAAAANPGSEKVMAAAICAGLRSPSPWKELVREES